MSRECVHTINIISPRVWHTSKQEKKGTQTTLYSRDKTHRTGNAEGGGGSLRGKRKRKQDERTTQQQTNEHLTHNSAPGEQIGQQKQEPKPRQAKHETKPNKTEQTLRTQPTNCTAQARQTRPSAPHANQWQTKTNRNPKQPTDSSQATRQA